MQDISSPSSTCEPEAIGFLEDQTTERKSEEVLLETRQDQRLWQLSRKCSNGSKRIDEHQDAADHRAMTRRDLKEDLELLGTS
jgi:hypothetical protein